MALPPSDGPTSRFAAFQHKSFALYWAARFASTFSVQIVSVAVGWQVYDISRDPFDLGLVGLLQFAPALLLMFATGAAADRYNRRTIMALGMIVEAMCTGFLIAFTLAGAPSVLPIFVTLIVFGTARAFFNPAQSSLVVNLVPQEALSNAIAWNSSAWQVATIVGPVAGGLLYGVSPIAAYGAASVMFLAGTGFVLAIPQPAQRTTREPASWKTVIAGLSYIRREKVVLGAISLDLFAVLLGGATALLPVYARDILDLGPWGLGLLRAAPGVGAVAMAVFLAMSPIRSRAGFLMFICVFSFGAFTVVFGLSTTVWVSIVALALMGAFDMVSVFVRETLIQLWTPDEVRGRVNAVNMVFVGASNELGEFRAGVMATLIGTVAAVVVGGMGTMAVAALWAKMFPDLRRIQHLESRD
ncbi:MFS transporter [Amorphus sp. 3PC139-8]|uniref:MFS transporter n=1 Tax=Amorphus sp. 3PC139-8 TaxID=2735676 RepID=UPI00345C802A